AATFGEGTSLKRITVKLTDDPVTTGIDERLGWLGDPQIMEAPGWQKLPHESRSVIVGLNSGQVGAIK
ncbi:MAG: hypothetical protein WA918_03180, partial [Erythrobacter sp.]